MDMKNRQVRSIGRPRKNFSHNRKNRTKFEEAVLNNRVLRIHLYRENLDRLRSKKPTSQRALLGKRHSTSVYATPVQSSKSPSAIHSFKTGFIRKRNSSGADQSPSSTKTRRKDFENNNLKTETTLPKPQIINKSQSKNKAVGKSTEKQKTLNKTINKNKFKIRLFPKSVGKATPMKRVVNNGKVQNSVNISDDVSMNDYVKPGQRYYLQFPHVKPLQEGILGYDFHNLVADVKTLQLPGPSWKIKVIIKHNKIAALIFTNKLQLERSVSFNSDSDKYNIVIDNLPVLLLGSPEKVCSATEVEVLLNIIEKIERDNPMILYK